MKKQIIENTIEAIDNLFPHSIYENWEICNKYLSHSLIILKNANDFRIISEKVARIHLKTGRYLREINQYKKAETHLKKAIAFYKTLKGKKMNLLQFVLMIWHCCTSRRVNIKKRNNYI